MFFEDLVSISKWNEFLDYKLSKDFVSKSEKNSLFDFITNKHYLPICQKIVSGNYEFSIPKKHLISKGHSGKKRVVYTFSDYEMIILKYISYLLYDYDSLFSPNLYSYRKSSGVKEAIRNISTIKNLNNMYGYKVDIKNYFNSINSKILLDNLKDDISDVDLYNLIHHLLSNDNAIYNDEIIIEKKGAMAGVPISAFLANYYIKEIDEYFWNKKLVYLRYADDIIIFCNTKDELIENQQILLKLIKKYNLDINVDKEYFFEPQDEWEFLGFSFCGKKIDISKNSLRKIKAKIRRSARGIRRWMIKKDADYKVALKAMNRKYNRKFYGKQNKEELSWKYWFLPTINTSKRLKIVDNYMQENLRYIATGKHNKRNYNVAPYELLKECNYKPLVSEYYKMLSLNMENNV